MSKYLPKLFLLISVVCFSSVTFAASYSNKNANEIRRVLQKAGVDNSQGLLLIRRMEARNIPVKVAWAWSHKILELKEKNLPVDVAVDRLQQGLIKNIKIDYLDRALNKLVANLNWSSELVTSKTLPAEQQAGNLDSDELELLNQTTQNLEIATRQGYKQNDISILLSRRGVDLEMAAELSKTLTVWTNYGVDSKRVLLSLKRISRLRLSADKVEDIREDVDSKVVADGLEEVTDIAKVIWQEIRSEAEVQDAEHAYRTGLQRNPNSLKGAKIDDGNLDNLDSVNMDASSFDSGSGGEAGIDTGSGGSTPYEPDSGAYEPDSEPASDHGSGDESSHDSSDSVEYESGGHESGHGSGH